MRKSSVNTERAASMLEPMRASRKSTVSYDAFLQEQGPPILVRSIRIGPRILEPSKETLCGLVKFVSRTPRLNTEPSMTRFAEVETFSRLTGSSKKAP